MAESDMVNAVERRLTRAEAAAAAKKRAQSKKPTGNRFAGLGEIAKKAVEGVADISTAGLYSGIKTGSQMVNAMMNRKSAPQAPAMSRAEAATAAREKAADYIVRKEMEDSLNMPPAPALNRAEATTAARKRAAAPTATPATPTAAPAAAPTAAPAAAPTAAPDSEALIAALGEAPPVQPAETAPRTAEVEAAYKEIEAGNVPKAIPVNEEMAQPELDENRMAALFRTTTGTAFNPKSKADAGRMSQLRDFVGSNPDMLNKSDTRIALDFYRTL